MKENNLQRTTVKGFFNCNLLIGISTQIIMAIVENLKNIWLRDFANNTLSALWSSVENFYTQIKDSLLLFFSSTRVKNRHT